MIRRKFLFTCLFLLLLLIAALPGVVSAQSVRAVKTPGAGYTYCQQVTWVAQADSRWQNIFGDGSVWMDAVVWAKMDYFTPSHYCGTIHGMSGQQCDNVEVCDHYYANLWAYAGGSYHLVAQSKCTAYNDGTQHFCNTSEISTVVEPYHEENTLYYTGGGGNTINSPNWTP
jgi:hypothetical protein